MTMLQGTALYITSRFISMLLAATCCMCKIVLFVPFFQLVATKDGLVVARIVQISKHSGCNLISITMLSKNRPIRVLTKK